MIRRKGHLDRGGASNPTVSTLSSVSTFRRGHRLHWTGARCLLLIPLILYTLFLFWTYTTVRYSSNDAHKSLTPSGLGIDVEHARLKLNDVRNEFYHRYGGKNEAEAIYRRGILKFEDVDRNSLKSGALDSDARFSSSLYFTAQRILHALAPISKTVPILDDPRRSEKNRFKMSFAGYSVTVGRGNHFEQSFPFIVENILSPLFDKIFGLDLVVMNAAIGGIPSFPYGWCLRNFLGEDPDVISWDFSMNEGNGGSIFESYIRHAISSFSSPTRHPPMIILLDRKETRVNMLKEYVRLGVLHDPIAVGRAADAVDLKSVLEVEDSLRPEGFQKWNQWGSPNGAPGQSSWHPKFKEHELIGWMIAMYFVNAMDLALEMLKRSQLDGNKELSQSTFLESFLPLRDPRILPTPVSFVAEGQQDSLPSLMFGVQSENEKGSWRMNHVSCRTSFLPSVTGSLSSIIVSGAEIVGTETDLEWVLRDTYIDSNYSGSWSLDVGQVERDTKRKVSWFGGLGYIDMKYALYGLSVSGTLRLWLPYQKKINLISSHSSLASEPDYFAFDLYHTLVFCEVNEKRGSHECNMAKDLSFVIDGKFSATPVTQISNVASYLKKLICINVPIPKGARLKKRKDTLANRDPVTSESIRSENGDDLGLLVDVQVVRKNLTKVDGACSISHVIWELQ